jgi:hypothetical protein
VSSTPRKKSARAALFNLLVSRETCVSESLREHVPRRVILRAGGPRPFAEFE